MGKCPRHKSFSYRRRASTEPPGKKLRKQWAVSTQGSPLKSCTALLSTLILPSHPFTLLVLASASWCLADSRTPVFTCSDSWKGPALWWHNLLSDGQPWPESVAIQQCRVVVHLQPPHWPNDNARRAETRSRRQEVDLKQESTSGKSAEWRDRKRHRSHYQEANARK